MRDEPLTTPLVMLGDPGAAVCDGDVCYLPSSVTPPLAVSSPVTPPLAASSPATSTEAAAPAAGPDGEDTDRPQ